MPSKGILKKIDKDIKEQEISATKITRIESEPKELKKAIDIEWIDHDVTAGFD